MAISTQGQDEPDPRQIPSATNALTAQVGYLSKTVDLLLERTRPFVKPVPDDGRKDGLIRTGDSVCKLANCILTEVDRVEELRLRLERLCNDLEV